MHNNMNVNVSGPMQPSSQYKTVVLKGQAPFAAQITEPNIKYVIKHNFDLGGEEITIPEGCLLKFDGGAISNGTLVGQSTILIYNQPLNDILTATLEGTWRHESGVKADEEDITDLNGELKLKDRGTTNGMGKIILRKNKTFAEQLTQENTIYEIRYDFDLGGATITIPANCILEFDGGSLNNGTIIGDETVIEAPHTQIFKSNLSVTGTYANDLKVVWFLGNQTQVSPSFLQRLTEHSIDFEGVALTCLGSTYIGAHNINWKNLTLYIPYIMFYSITNSIYGDCSNTSGYYQEITSEEDVDSSNIGKMILISTGNKVPFDDRPDERGVPTLYKGLTSEIESISGHSIGLKDYIDAFNKVYTYGDNNIEVTSHYSIVDGFKIRLENCNFVLTEFQNSLAGCVSIIHSNDLQITNCSFTSYNKIGSEVLLSIGSCVNGVISESKVTNSWYSGSRESYGIQFSSCTRMIVCDCFFDNNRRAIDFSGSYECRYCVAESNIIYGQGKESVGSAIGGHSTSYGTIYRNNTITGRFQIGIECRGTSEVIDGNTFWGNYSGALISIAFNTTVCNNIHSTAHGTTLTSNVIYGNTIQNNILYMYGNEIKFREHLISGLVPRWSYIYDNWFYYCHNSSGNTYLFNSSPNQGEFVNNVLINNTPVKLAPTAVLYNFKYKWTYPMKVTSWNGGAVSGVTDNGSYVIVDNTNLDNPRMEIHVKFTASSNLSGNIALTGFETNVDLSKFAKITGLGTNYTLIAYKDGTTNTDIVVSLSDKIYIGYGGYNKQFAAGTYEIVANTELNKNNYISMVRTYDSAASVSSYSLDNVIRVDKRLVHKSDGDWYLTNGFSNLRLVGRTVNRPRDEVKETDIGFVYFDTDLNKPIWIKSVDTSTTPKIVVWVDATGATV